MTDATIYVYVLCTYKLKLCNLYIYVHVLHWSVNIRLTIYAFVILLLAMISLLMLTFWLVVTMVADFCSLVILIHNTLLGAE